MIDTERLTQIYAEATRRMTDYELLEAALGEITTKNTVALPVPEIAGGFVVCVKGTVFHPVGKSEQEPQDSLTITEDGQLQYQAEGMSRQAFGHYVALWPGKKAAALYDIHADFTPIFPTTAQPFKSLAEENLKSTNIERLTSPEEDPDVTVYAVKESESRRARLDGLEVVSATGAQLAVEKVEPTKPGVKTQAWKLRVSGAVGVKVEEGRFTRVDSRSVQTSAASEESPLVVDVPAEGIAIHYNAPLGATVVAGPDGSFMLQKSGGALKPISIRLSANDVYRLAGDKITWQDATEAFLKDNKDHLLKKVLVEGRREIVNACARVAMEQAFNGASATVEGPLHVLRQLQKDAAA